MKILLINPSGGPKKDYGALSKAGSELPQLGLASVATSLLGSGHKVKIIDYKIEGFTLKRLLGIITRGKYTLVGFSVYITSVKKTFFLAKKIKKAFSKIKICVGGPQVTLTPYDFQKNYIDFVFIGEAEESILKLVSFLKSKKKYPRIKGMLYNNGKSLKGNSTLNLIEDLDSLPLIKLDRFYNLVDYYPPIYIRGKKIINLVSSRGCPFQCSFCAAAEVNGRRVRQMTASRFVDYIEIYVKKGFDSFMFYDDTFTVNRKRVIDICKEIVKRKMKLSWNCWSRVDCIDPVILSHMKEAGCYLMVFGCESMNNKTLRMLNKGFTAGQSLKGIEMVKKAGLLAVSSFMLGLPRETKKDILHTIKVVNNTQLDFAVWPIFEPYKGTPIYRICKREGSWIKDKRFKNVIMADQEEIWEPNTISRQEIEKLAQYAFRSFYFKPYFVTTFLRTFTKLPLKRKRRFFMSGLDYFVFSKIRLGKKEYQRGSRYR